jgi:hypothetical protein
LTGVVSKIGSTGLRTRDLDEGLWMRTEDLVLFNCLRCSHGAKLSGPISCQHDERDVCQPCFGDGWSEVRGGSAGGTENGYRRFTGSRHAECEIGASPLVEMRPCVNCVVTLGFDDEGGGA